MQNLFSKAVKIKRRYCLQSILLATAYLYMILFPADYINIKEILLLSAIIITLPTIIIDFFYRKKHQLLYIFGILYPFVTFLTSILLGESNFFDALSYGYVWVILLLIPGLLKYNVDFTQIFLVGTVIVATIVNSIFFLDISNLCFMQNNPLILILDSLNEIKYGKGSVATFGYFIFYKSVPLLIVTLGYFLWKKKILQVFWITIALAVSGTRANIVAVALLFLFFMFSIQANLKKKMLISSIAIMGICLILPSLIEKMILLNELKTNLDNVKIEHLKSIFYFLNNNPLYYLYGSGVGSYFYSTGIDNLTNVVEVSYFDYFRQVGLIGFTLFMLFLLIPLKFLYKTEIWLFYSYIVYLAVAFTNPLLVSSTSFVLYMLVYAMMYYHNNKLTSEWLTNRVNKITTF